MLIVHSEPIGNARSMAIDVPSASWKPWLDGATGATRTAAIVICVSKYGTAASRCEYRRFTADWAAKNGCIVDRHDLSVAELFKQYRQRHDHGQPEE